MKILESKELKGFEEYLPYRFRGTGKFNRLFVDYKYVWVDGERYSKRITFDVSYDYENYVQSLGFNHNKYLVRTLKENGKTEASDHYVEDKVVSLAPFCSCNVENFDWDPFWSGCSFSVFRKPAKVYGKDYIYVTGSSNPYIAMAYGICKFYNLEVDYGRTTYLHNNQTDIKFCYDAIEYGSGYSLSLMFSIQDILNMDVDKWSFNEYQLLSLKNRLERIKWIPKELFLVFERPLTDIEKITIATKMFTNYSKNRKQHYETC